MNETSVNTSDNKQRSSCTFRRYIDIIL